ncbi:hypothetical protein P3T76_010955 [Phytophthora citrophthora]|uniref:Uncharacterized protein n=1 Tax=Phytophthora citrophthora TaxID=4793 RepID=A0AAD9GB90_9STRA|nr:hypothetical protein P3T76_010955 [Phytophthora citrophthora]
MPTTLELLRAELQEQEAEEARPALRSLDEVRSFISNTQPAPNVNISLEMCLLRIEEHEDKWRLELVNFADAGDFPVLLEQYQPLDVSRRNKYVFGLTLWKSRNASMNKLEYRQGFCYRFDKVHSLKVLYGNLVGSIQIRQQMRAEPVVTPQPSDTLIPESAGVSMSSNLTCGSSSHVSGDELAATLQRDRDGARLTPPQTPSTLDDELPVATPATKASTKRKPHKENGVGASTKYRKQNPKALSFESPPRAAIIP